MRVLFLSPREAWPANSGAKLRDFYLAQGLAAASDLTYVFFGSEFAAKHLRERLGNAAAVTPPSKYTTGKILRGVFGNRPLPVENYTSVLMRQALDDVLRRGGFDLVHLDSIHMAGYVQQLRLRCPTAMITLDWHNIESEAMLRYSESAPSQARRLYARYTAHRLESLENRMLQSCSGHLVCSERERNLLSLRNPCARVAVIANGVDTQYFHPSSTPVQQKLLFVGQMSYAPNVQAAVWFARTVWPKLRERFPALLLSIVGADPVPSVRELSSLPGIDVTGTVPDVRPYYDGALAAVVPLSTGAGTRLKILEAMAAGAPVISTQLGAEGLEIRDRVHFLLASEPQSWLDAVTYLQNEARRNEMRDAARALVCGCYNWKFLGSKISDTYRQWLNLAR